MLTDGRTETGTGSQKMTGASFERVISERNEEYRKYGMAEVSKCGVHAIRSKDGWQVIPSFPDYEGVVKPGLQFVFDAKVCTQASFDLSKYREETRGPRARQIRHMFRRSRYGVPSFFLIHWNGRDLKSKSYPAQTFVLPVSGDIVLWERFMAAEQKSLTREDCEEFGIRVQWNSIGRGRKVRPDYLTAIRPLFSDVR